MRKDSLQMIFRRLIPMLLLPCLLVAQGSWQSQIVYYDSNNKLVYVHDGEGNRIPDFSYAGYKNSEQPIPDVPVVKTIAPIVGDNTQHIQDALFEIGLMPADNNGIRGALLLEAGEYEIQGTIHLAFSGVVLRGVGDGADPDSNTVLKATGDSPHWRTVIIAGGGSRTNWADGVDVRDIITDTVFVGDNQFEVTDASPFSVGDNIIIFHPCTQAWLSAVDTGGTFWWLPAAEPGVDVPWTVDSQPIVYNRNITAIEGNKITIDVPVYNPLVRSLSQSYIYKYTRMGIRTKIGIEKLRIDIQANGVADENHAWDAIDMYQLEDSWVRDCTMLHFGLSAVKTGTATRITIENCRAFDPRATVEGGKMYNFQMYRSSQQILVKDCQARNGRHHYMSNGTSSASGIVFLDCTSSGAYTSSEGHRRWTQGMLYDNVIDLDGPRPGFNPRLLGLYCRGHYGTSHGWAAVHSVAWACDVAAGDLIVQKPPTGQNYAIGCFGNISGQSPPAPFPVPEGYIEGTNQPGLEPRSLFYAQLADRGIVSTVKPKRPEAIPTILKLYANYPNPFNPSTRIRFELSEASDIELVISDVLGRKIVTLAAGHFRSGSHELFWNGLNDRGRPVSSGIYFYLLKAGRQIQSRKMVLLR